MRWAQTKSMWPDTFGLACCAIEMMSIVSSRYDLARFGMEAFRSSPRQADLLIVSGRVAHKMAAPLRQIYDQMLEPKWVIAMGVCASSGGMFNNYTILQGVDRDRPRRHLHPVLPAAAGGADGGDHPPARGAPGRRAAPRTSASRWRRELTGQRSGLRLSPRRPFDETTVTVETRADPRGVRARTRRARLRRAASTSSRPTTSTGAARASPATSAPRSGRDLKHPMTQGLQALPEQKPKRFSISYHLLALRAAAAPRAPAVLARRGRVGAERDLASGRPPTGTSASSST